MFFLCQHCEALITSKLGVQALNTDPRIEGLYWGRPCREAFKSSIGTWSRRKTTVMMLRIALQLAESGPLARKYRWYQPW